jgi:hypothetical protein
MRRTTVGQPPPLAGCAPLTKLASGSSLVARFANRLAMEKKTTIFSPTGRKTAGQRAGCFDGAPKIAASRRCFSAFPRSTNRGRQADRLSRGNPRTPTVRLPLGKNKGLELRTSINSASTSLLPMHLAAGSLQCRITKHMLCETVTPLSSGRRLCKRPGPRRHRPHTTLAGVADITADVQNCRRKQITGWAKKMVLRGPKTGAAFRPQFWDRESTNDPRNSSPAYLLHDLCWVLHGPKIGAGKRPQNWGRILATFYKKGNIKSDIQVRTWAFAKLHFTAKAEQPE